MPSSHLIEVTWHLNTYPQNLTAIWCFFYEEKTLVAKYCIFHSEPRQTQLTCLVWGRELLPGQQTVHPRHQAGVLGHCRALAPLHPRRVQVCTVLYCSALCCTVLYCTVLYFTVVYCTVLYCTVPPPCLGHPRPSTCGTSTVSRCPGRSHFTMTLPPGIIWNLFICNTMGTYLFHSNPNLEFEKNLEQFWNRKKAKNQWDSKTQNLKILQYN